MSSCLFLFSFIGHILAQIKIYHTLSLRFSCQQLIQPSSSRAAELRGGNKKGGRIVASNNGWVSKMTFSGSLVRLSDHYFHTYCPSLYFSKSGKTKHTLLSSIESQYGASLVDYGWIWSCLCYFGIFWNKGVTEFHCIIEMFSNDRKQVMIYEICWWINRIFVQIC